MTNLEHIHRNHYCEFPGLYSNNANGINKNSFLFFGGGGGAELC